MYLSNEIQKKLKISLSDLESLNTLLIFSETSEEYEYNLFELIKSDSFHNNNLKSKDNINVSLIQYNGSKLIQYRQKYNNLYNFYKSNLIKLENFIKASN